MKNRFVLSLGFAITAVIASCCFAEKTKSFLENPANKIEAIIEQELKKVTRILKRMDKLHLLTDLHEIEEEIEDILISSINQLDSLLMLIESKKETAEQKQMIHSIVGGFCSFATIATT